MPETLDAMTKQPSPPTLALLIAVLLLSAGIVGCEGAGQTETAQIEEALFSFMLQHEHSERYETFCLMRMDDSDRIDPGAAILANLSAEDFPVRAISECVDDDYRPRGDVIGDWVVLSVDHRASRRRSSIRAEIGWYPPEALGGLGSWGYECELQRSGRRWVVAACPVSWVS